MNNNNMFAHTSSSNKQRARPRTADEAIDLYVKSLIYVKKNRMVVKDQSVDSEGCDKLDNLAEIQNESNSGSPSDRAKQPTNNKHDWVAECLLKMESENKDLPLWRFNNTRGSFEIPFRTEKYREWVRQRTY